MVTLPQALTREHDTREIYAYCRASVVESEAVFLPFCYTYAMSRPFESPDGQLSLSDDPSEYMFEKAYSVEDLLFLQNITDDINRSARSDRSLSCIGRSYRDCLAGFARTFLVSTSMGWPFIERRTKRYDNSYAVSYQLDLLPIHTSFDPQSMRPFRITATMVTNGNLVVKQLSLSFQFYGDVNIDRMMEAGAYAMLKNAHTNCLSVNETALAEQLSSAIDPMKMNMRIQEDNFSYDGMSRLCGRPVEVHRFSTSSQTILTISIGDYPDWKIRS